MAVRLYSIHTQQNEPVAVRLLHSHSANSGVSTSQMCSGTHSSKPSAVNNFSSFQRAMGRSIYEHCPAPLIIRPSEEFTQSCTSAADAAVVATHKTHIQQQEKAKRKEGFHKGLQYRLARIQYEKRKASKDKIPRARPEAMEVSSMGILVLRHRAEYEERGQASQYFSDVWKCAMEMERRKAREFADRMKLRSGKLNIDKAAERALRLKLAWERQTAAVDQQMEVVARKRSRLEHLLEITRNRNLEDALTMDRIERLQRQGLRVPPLCSCRHGVSPWNLRYIDYCDKGCPLYHNHTEYQRRLMETLRDIFKDAHTLDARILNIIFWSRKSAYEDPLVVEKREQIWEQCRSHERSRFLKAMQLVHIERMRREGVVLPPLCGCNHGLYALDPAYVKRCHHSCPLYHNPDEYKRRLLCALECMLEKTKQEADKQRDEEGAEKPITINVKWKPNKPL